MVADDQHTSARPTKFTPSPKAKAHRLTKAGPARLRNGSVGLDMVVDKIIAPGCPTLSVPFLVVI